MALIVPVVVAGLTCALAATLYLLARPQIGDAPSGERLARMRASAAFMGGRFVNGVPTRTLSSGGLLETLRMYGEPAVRAPRRPLPTLAVPAGSFNRKPADGLRVTWLGHSAFVIELDGALLLTDPALYSRASPFTWVGPNRFFAAPLSIRDLPELDAVLVSHDHYDHLAMAEIRALIPKARRFVVPLGVGAVLEGWGVRPDRIVELDWWQEVEVSRGVRVIATPARHFSGRGFRRDGTLWASISVVGPEHRLFFSGDSGLTDAFSEIGRRLGPFDCTIIKIGAYGRAWPDIHLTPEQALEVHRMVRGRVMIPAHWGTYSLSAHSWNEPADRLLDAAGASGIPVIVPVPGQSVVPASPPPPVRWWDAAVDEKAAP